MKTMRILIVVGMVLVGTLITARANAMENPARTSDKDALTLTIDKPVVEYMAKALNGPVEATDIFRMQKMAGQVDHITVSFKDRDASDYILKFKELDEQGLESWMFSNGYLSGEQAYSGQLSEASVQKKGSSGFHLAKKRALQLTVDKPMIEYLAKIYHDEIDYEDIQRLIKVCSQIDHITVTFRDRDAADYVLSFRCPDKRELESWMFNEGYLDPETDAVPAPIESWMLDPEYLE